jgi:uncharacterized protein YutE (UPF0331/DUF86 family)
MVAPDVLARRLLSLNEALAHLERHAAGLTPQTLAADAMLEAAIERWLQVAIEACVDCAYHIVAERGLVPPESARAAFADLTRAGAIPAELASKLGRAVGMRNILVHDYTRIDRTLLVAAIQRDLPDLRAFGAAVAQLLDSA